MNDLANIVQAACERNQMIKADVGRCAFAPFLVEPSSVWDPDRMESESFERLRVPVQSGSQIISPISLGVLGSVTRDGGMSRSLYVQQKAQVLVNEPTNRKQRRAMKCVQVYNQCVLTFDPCSTLGDVKIRCQEVGVRSEVSQASASVCV